MRADLNATVLLEGSALIVIGSKPYLQRSASVGMT